jgi:hypothetical protein
VTAREEPLASASAGDPDLVQVARQRMLDEGWDLVICLTDQPLFAGRRPVTAHASVTHGVGLVSVPALGPVALEANVTEAVLRLLDRLLGQDRERSRRRRRRRRRLVPSHLVDRGSPVGQARTQDGGTVKFTTAVVGGNLRLLFGMVRANRPYRLVAGLSRALAAALGTAAFGLCSPGVWQIADGMGWARPPILSAVAVIVTSASLIVAHGLWEHVPHGRPSRERVLLFNLATAATVLIGVVTLYLALLAIILGCAEAVIVPSVLEQQLQHHAGFADYFRLAMLVSMLATVGGALGAALESHRVGRQAAYGYHPED